jgi:hypothetical protein
MPNRMLQQVQNGFICSNPKFQLIYIQIDLAIEDLCLAAILIFFAILFFLLQFIFFIFFYDFNFQIF